MGPCQPGGYRHGVWFHTHSELQRTGKVRPVPCVSLVGGRAVDVLRDIDNLVYLFDNLFRVGCHQGVLST